MYIYKTVELVCGSLMNDGQDQDVYYIHKNNFKELYELEASTLIADYDSDESGDITTEEETQRIGQVGFSR